MSQTRNCERCGTEYEAVRADNRFCREVACKRARQKARWEKWRTAREADGTFRTIENERQQNYRQRTGYARDYELRTKYGITLDEWMAMVAAVNGRCEICRKADEALCVDHDHETGRVRGVLCRSCNRAIGQLGDTEAHLQSALDYLRKAAE
jgi:hypothetical protein